MQDVFILSAVRTPIGKFQGALSPVSAPLLGAAVVREAVRRAGVDSAAIDEVIMGNVLTAGLGQNPARQAALRGGLSDSVGAMTINKVCGSGLKAVALAAQAIQTENSELVVAGGMESMSNAPYLLPNARTGLRMGDAKLIDSMVHDGLWDCYENCHMGITAEAVAEKYGVTREEQDSYACGSHRKAIEAMKTGRFAAEIVGVEVPGAKSQTAMVDKDESPREDSTTAALGKLRPAFKKEGGTVTAGNAPGVNDGAAAVVVAPESYVRQSGKKPLARIVGQATSGIAPLWVMMAPVEAVNRLLKKVGWDRDEVDLYELNEAFAVQAIAVTRELRLDPAKVNVNGGAVALGHPIGASGARVLVTLLHAMEQRHAKKGVAGLCLGGGNAVALAVERV